MVLMTRNQKCLPLELFLGTNSRKMPFWWIQFFGRIIENSWNDYMQNSELYNNRVKVH